MIERHAYFRFHDEYSNDASRAEAVAASRDLLPKVPGVVSATVGVPADEDCHSKWDLMLIIRFNSVDDIEGYIVHPTHQKLVQETLKPRIKVRKVWNFDVSE